MSDHNAKKSFFSDLWERRFFQYFATYIAASWGAIQFLEWGVKRYSIPSIWVDKLVVFLLILLPFIISLIYFHGKAGDDKWWKFEKVLYPINVVGALVMSLFLVNSSAGPATEEVTIMDTEGQTIVREIPTQKFNRRVAIFPVDGGNDQDLWQRFGLSELLNNKLEQDMSMLVTSASSMSTRYDHYGFVPFQELPFATKQKISVADYSDFFVETKYVANDITSLDVSIYDTKTGKEVSQKIIESTDLFDAADQVGALINENVKLNEVEGKSTYVDLPAVDLITSDTAALKDYLEATILLDKKGTNLPQSAELLKQSVAHDPTCAECWSRLTYAKMLSGQDSNEEKANALKYAVNLPERQQLSIKYFSYLVENDTDKAIKLCEMWRKLYPKDTKPVFNLISIYKRLFRIEDAKKVAKEAIDGDHKGSIYLTYANLLISSKNWSEAEIYLKKYKELYPKQYEASSLLVDTYTGKGKYKEALDAIDELIIMKPMESAYVLKKAGILAKQNKISEGIDVLKGALKNITSPNDSIQNYLKQLEVYSRGFKFDEYGRVRRALKNTFLSNFPPIQYIQTEYATISYYKLIGEIDSIGYHLESVSSLVAPARRGLVTNLNNFMMKLFAEDKEGIDEAYASVRPVFESMGSKFVTYLYEAEIAYRKGDYEQAKKSFQLLVADAPSPEMITDSYFELFVKTEEYEEGLEAVNAILIDDPLHPQRNYYKAKYLFELGNTSEAKDVLSQVLPIYKEADPRTIHLSDVMKLATDLGF